MGPKMRAKPLAPASPSNGAMGMNHLQQIPVKVCESDVQHPPQKKMHFEQVPDLQKIFYKTPFAREG